MGDTAVVESAPTDIRETFTPDAGEQVGRGGWPESAADRADTAQRVLSRVRGANG